MLQPDFDREMQRLRNHFGDRNYTSELVKILWKELGAMHVATFSRLVSEAIATCPVSRPPLRDDFRKIAETLGIGLPTAAKSWNHFVVDDCMTCGGIGYFFIRGPEDRLATRACDSCASGKNLQNAPRPIVSIAKIPNGWEYSHAGRSNSCGELHPELKRRFGDVAGLEKAIVERRVSQREILKGAINIAQEQHRIRTALHKED